jgi:hypothetical protein
MRNVGGLVRYKLLEVFDLAQKLRWGGSCWLVLNFHRLLGWRRFIGNTIRTRRDQLPGATRRFLKEALGGGGEIPVWR